MKNARHHMIRIGLQLIDERKTKIDVIARLGWDDTRDYLPRSMKSDLLSVLGGYTGPEWSALC